MIIERVKANWDSDNLPENEIGFGDSKPQHSLESKYVLKRESGKLKGERVIKSEWVENLEETDPRYKHLFFRP